MALTFIDWDTTLLPDDLTLPLVWLRIDRCRASLDPRAAGCGVCGASGRISLLWTVYWAFKLVTGKEGMGYGDFKLFAALGAWFGWQALIPMILIASSLAPSSVSP